MGISGITPSPYHGFTTCSGIVCISSPYSQPKGGITEIVRASPVKTFITIQGERTDTQGTAYDKVFNVYQVRLNIPSRYKRLSVYYHARQFVRSHTGATCKFPG